MPQAMLHYKAIISIEALLLMLSKKIISLIIIIVTVISILTVACFASDTVGLENPELDIREGNIPFGWRVSSYLDNDYSLFAIDGTVILHNNSFNDLRLYQDITVQPKHTYIVTAQIRTEDVSGGRGASISIDNYSLDGSCIYSNGISDSQDWTNVTLCFETVAKQRNVRVALRLGGYRESSEGVAEFRNISFSEVEDYRGEVQVLNPWGKQSDNSTSSQGDTGTEELTEMRKIELKSYLQVFVILSIVFAVVLLGGFYRYRDKIADKTIKEENCGKIFFLICLGGFVLRSVLATITGGHDSDISCWIGWGDYIANYGPSTFYTAAGHEWYDYPPGYMLILGFISKLLSLLQIPAYSNAGVFAYILPAYLADIGIAFYLMRLSEECGKSNAFRLVFGALVIFNPAAFILSGAWGQIDSILTFLLLAVFDSLRNNRRIIAGILYGLSIMIKWQALIYGPVLAIGFILTIRYLDDIWKTVIAVLCAVAVIIVVSLPFQGNQSLFWVIDRFLASTGGYAYASVEAYNFMSLLGGNWAPVTNTIFGTVSYKTFGVICILIAIVISGIFQWSQQKHLSFHSDRQTQDTSGVFLSAAFCMFAIYTFGHFMHERYVFPVIFLLMAAYLLYNEPKFLSCSLFLSCVAFLNECSAQYVVSQLASAAVRGTREHQTVVYICALAEVLVFIYFLKAFIDTAIYINEEVDK